MLESRVTKVSGLNLVSLPCTPFGPLLLDTIVL